EKHTVALGGVAAEVAAALEAANRDLLSEATAFRDARTADAGTLEEAVEEGSAGFARVPMKALGDAGEDRVAQHALTVRCRQRPDGSLAARDDPEDGLVAVVGRSY